MIEEETACLSLVVSICREGDAEDTIKEGIFCRGMVSEKARRDLVHSWQDWL